MQEQRALVSDAASMGTGQMHVPIRARSCSSALIEQHYLRNGASSTCLVSDVCNVIFQCVSLKIELWNYLCIT